MIRLNATFLVLIFRNISPVLRLLLCLLAVPCWSQMESAKMLASDDGINLRTKGELNVHWLYGPYVPKEGILLPLDGYQRRILFVRQAFTTPGIYVRSAFLGLVNQAGGTPSDWGGGLQGYGRRVASNYGRTLIQTSLAATGNAALQYEPRYDRCHCGGLGARTKHALLRNFMTYNRSEREWRPQFAMYGAALGAGMLSSVWQPQSKPWVEGYNCVLSQAGIGVLSNWVGEFWPEIKLRINPQTRGANRSR